MADKVDFHRNGIGGAGYYIIALDGLPDTPDRMLAIVPSDAVRDEDDQILPMEAHIPEILVIDPIDCVPFAYNKGTPQSMNGWRGADYWSKLVMEALHAHEERITGRGS